MDPAHLNKLFSISNWLFLIPCYCQNSICDLWNTLVPTVWSLLITNDLLPDMVIVLWRINFKSIPCMREHFCRQSCYPCPFAKHDQSSGEGGCTLRTIVLFQRSWEKKHTKLSNFHLKTVVTLIYVFSNSWHDKKRFQLWVLQLLMNFSFWWSCFWWDASDELASDDVITSGALCTSGAPFFRRFKLPFCWFFCSLLFFQNPLNI